LGDTLFTSKHDFVGEIVWEDFEDGLVPVWIEEWCVDDLSVWIVCFFIFHCKFIMESYNINTTAHKGRTWRMEWAWGIGGVGTSVSADLETIEYGVSTTLFHVAEYKTTEIRVEFFA
jgi:hypothetical protein